MIAREIAELERRVTLAFKAKGTPELVGRAAEIAAWFMDDDLRECEAELHQRARLARLLSQVRARGEAEL